MRVLICGDRNWKDYFFIRKVLSARLKPTDLVIEGGARGADTLARTAALSLKIEVMEFPAEWAKYGKAAGPIRNKKMLDVGRPDQVWAFHDNIQGSRGTKNMITLAHQAGCERLYRIRVPGRGSSARGIVHDVFHERRR